MRFSTSKLVAMVFALVLSLAWATGASACERKGRLFSRFGKACDSCNTCQTTTATAKAPCANTCTNTCANTCGTLAGFTGRVAGAVAGAAFAPVVDFSQSARTSAAKWLGRSRCAGGVCR